MHQIVKQPDGKFAIFSKLGNCFIAEDMTPEEIVNMDFKVFKLTTLKAIKNICIKLDKGEKVYLSPVSYETARAHSAVEAAEDETEETLEDLINDELP